MTVQLSFGKITADKQTLNSLAILIMDERDLTRKDYPLVSEAYAKDYNIIWDALDKAGFYDDVRARV